jgi:hypothetical protein
LIKRDWCKKNLAHYLTPTREARSNNLLVSFSISTETLETLFLAKARITNKDPAGNFARFGETEWRTLRAKAWRATDPPTDLLMINPHFGRS